jgi:lysine biosynthesis protein LysW
MIEERLQRAAALARSARALWRKGSDMNARVVASCPACGGIVEVVDPEIGREVDCPDCEEALLVTALDPLTLDYALDTDEAGSFPDEERREA